MLRRGVGADDCMAVMSWWQTFSAFGQSQTQMLRSSQHLPRTVNKYTRLVDACSLSFA